MLERHTMQCHHQTVIWRPWVQPFRLLLWVTLRRFIKAEALSHHIYKNRNWVVQKHSCKVWSQSTYKIVSENNAGADANRKCQSQVARPCGSLSDSASWLIISSSTNDKQWGNGSDGSKTKDTSFYPIISYSFCLFLSIRHK